MKTIVWLLVVAAMSLFAADDEVEPRHNQGGTIGPNGVMQKVDIRIFKTKVGADSAFIQLDLGEHKYDSVKSEVLTTQRPIIILKIGTTVIFQGQADKKGKIVSDNFTGKLVNKGKGIQFTLKHENLSALMGELSGKGEHVPMMVTIQDNHPPAAALTKRQRAAIEQAGPRHEHALYENMFELDVDETKKVLMAKG